MKICGIYKITNQFNKVYIGQSIDIQKRFKVYKRFSCKNQTKLYNSLKKYGVENHTFEIIEECIFEKLSNQERYWQEFYNVVDKGLNCHFTNDSNSPKKYSKETCKKISNALKGNTNCLGNIQSKETKIKRGLSLKGKKHSREHIEKIRKFLLSDKNTLRGRKRNEETKQKMRLAQIGENRKSAKLVLNTETGIYYSTIKEACLSKNIPYSTLKHIFLGRSKNKTNLILV
jgi:group I intron endonuclease